MSETKQLAADQPTFTEETIDSLRKMVADMLAKEPDGPAWNVMRILLERGDAWREIALATAPRCDCGALATRVHRIAIRPLPYCDACRGDHPDFKDLKHAAAARAVGGES